MPPSPFTALPASSAETLVVAPRSQAPVAAASGPFDSGEYSALPPGEAAASLNPQSSGAAVGIAESSSSTGGRQGSPAPGQELCGAGDLDDHRFVLDELAFMEAIEPPPLFLQGLHALAGH